MIKCTTCSFFKNFFFTALFVDGKIFTHSVKYYDGVVDRKAEYRKNCGHKKGVHFRAREMTKECKKADRNNNVVQKRNKGDEAIDPARNRLRNFTKCECDEKKYAEKNK